MHQDALQRLEYALGTSSSIVISITSISITIITNSISSTVMVVVVVHSDRREQQRASRRLTSSHIDNPTSFIASLPARAHHHSRPSQPSINPANPLSRSLTLRRSAER